MKLSTAKSAAAWAVEILIRVTGGICAGVLCGNESDYGGKFYGVYRIRWQSDTGKPVYL